MVNQTLGRIVFLVSAFFGFYGLQPGGEKVKQGLGVEATVFGCPEAGGTAQLWTKQGKDNRPRKVRIQFSGKDPITANVIHIDKPCDTEAQLSCEPVNLGGIPYTLVVYIFDGHPPAIYLDRAFDLPPSLQRPEADQRPVPPSLGKTSVPKLTPPPFVRPQDVPPASDPQTIQGVPCEGLSDDELAELVAMRPHFVPAPAGASPRRTRDIGTQTGKPRQSAPRRVRGKRRPTRAAAAGRRSHGLAR